MLTPEKSYEPRYDVSLDLDRVSEYLIDIKSLLEVGKIYHSGEEW